MNIDEKERLIKDEVVILLKEGIAKGRHPELQIVSHSMYPILKISDKILLKEVQLNNLSCGDIIVYKLNEHLIAHRFLYLQDDNFFITQGDNTQKLDLPVNKNSLVGKIVQIDKKDIHLNLETKVWRFTNFLIGRAFLKEAKALNKNIIIKLINLLESQFLKIIAKFVNPEYRRLSKKKEESLHLEKEFLKICSQKEITNQDIAILKTIANQGISWDWLFILAEYNSVAPILYINLSSLNADFIPEDFLERLKNNYTESFLKTASVYDDISKLLKEFNARGLKTIMLKGCSLGELIYQDFSLRPMKDVDILVKKTDWPQIKEILTKLGFEEKRGLDPLILETLMGGPIDFQLCYENKRDTRLEFKFNIFILDFPDFSSTDNYWNEALDLVVAGNETLGLSLEDQILHLSCRLISVGFRNLLWFCDLREFIQHYQNKIDWQKLIIKAKSKRIDTILYYSLLILKEQMDVNVAQEILNSLKPNLLKKWLFEHLYSYESILFKTPYEIEWPNPLIALCVVFGKLPFTLKDIKRFLIYMKKQIFPPQEYISYRYKILESGLPKHSYYFRVKKLLVRLLMLGRIILGRLF
ncbi:MAG: signal peptidase I [Candidatus Omnitrophota bacterium]|nr:signal peptidase I [Candidatus Omnitrophota bacterium]